MAPVVGVTVDHTVLPVTHTFIHKWLVGWGLTALLTQNRSYRACRFV